MPPAFESVTTYPHAVWMWMKELGKPLALGIVLLASTLAASGIASCASRGAGTSSPRGGGARAGARARHEAALVGRGRRRARPPRPRDAPARAPLPGREPEAPQRRVHRARRAITGQQISVKAADAIWRRFVAAAAPEQVRRAFPKLDPARVVALAPEAFRRSGTPSARRCT
jgi:hypothetical protein